MSVMLKFIILYLSQIIKVFTYYINIELLSDNFDDKIYPKVYKKIHTNIK